jgi:L,D-peptidoglycan transpeptidase YkuD (ErfK/YbiS/YcfS/YnhG family)
LSRTIIHLPSLILPAGSRQMLLALTECWDSFHVKLYLCENILGMWQVDKCFKAVCGQNGMAWGLGIYPASPAEQPQPAKQEGDRKSPAGIFSLGISMGYAPQLAVNSRLLYQQLTATMQGVDDTRSRHYNHIIDHSQLPQTEKADWNSHEVMRRADDLYKWLIVINHNPNNIPGSGSLIFMHIWKNENSGTAGCTALSEGSLLEILSWLDPAKDPVLVQLTQGIYWEKQVQWELPIV